jgi:hypothetical protein
MAAEGSATTAAVAPETILAGADEAPDEAVGAAAADMLAAMAAAAIASGAVAMPEVGALPEVGGAAGVSVTATVTGIAVAIAFIAVAASCCAEAAGSVEEPAAEVSSDEDFAVDFPASDFELPGFALEGSGGAASLVPELALEGGAAAEALWLLELLSADGTAAVPFCDPPLFAAAAVLSEEDCLAGCGGAVAGALLASLAELLSTNAPKISFPGLESDLAARGGAL